MKVLHTADWHLGKRLQEYSRLQEQTVVLNEICAIADREQVDMVLIAGDVFDVFHPSHDAQDLLYKTLFRLSAGGTRPVVAIAGNHDSHALVEAALPLSRELGIILLGAGHSPVAPVHLPGGTIVEVPENGVVTVDFPHRNEKAIVLAAPYANEVLLRIYLGEENREDELRILLKKRWKELSEKYFAHGQHHFFLGHFFFMREGMPAEKEPESERSILHVGGAQALFTDDLPDDLHYAALGHLHRFHSVDERRFPVVYAGSPLCYSFSEAGQQKSVVIYDTSDGSYTPFPLNGGYDLVRKRFENVDEALNWLAANKDVYVELTLALEGALEGNVRRMIYQAHDHIVYLIPEVKDAAGEAQERVFQPEENIETLFRKYYTSVKSAGPSEKIMELFREVTGKKEGGI